MKAFAARSRDEEDLRRLADIIGIRSVADAVDVCTRFFPVRALAGAFPRNPRGSVSLIGLATSWRAVPMNSPKTRANERYVGDGEAVTDKRRSTGAFALIRHRLDLFGGSSYCGHMNAYAAWHRCHAFVPESPSGHKCPAYLLDLMYQWSSALDHPPAALAVRSILMIGIGGVRRDRPNDRFPNPPSLFAGLRAGAAATRRALPVALFAARPDQSVLCGTATIDCNGRLPEAVVIPALGWVSGTRLDIRVHGGLVLLTADPHAVFRMTQAGQVRLPATVRHWCGLTPGSRVLLAADVEAGRFVVHPPAARAGEVGGAEVGRTAPAPDRPAGDSVGTATPPMHRRSGRPPGDQHSWDDEDVNNPPSWPTSGRGDPHEMPPVAPGWAAQPPYPGYGQPYGPAPRRSANTGVWIGVAVAVVLCLCLGVAGGTGGLLYFGYKLDRSDAVAMLQEYLEDVSTENYPAAYDRLCDKAKAGVSREEFAQRFPPPRLVSFEIRDVSMATRDGEDGYNVKVELRFEDSRTRTETFFVFSTFSDVDTYYVCP